MAAAAQEETDGIVPSDAVDSSFSKLIIDAKEVSVIVENLKEQSSTKDESVIPGDTVEDAKSKDPPSNDIVGEVGSLDAGQGQNNGVPPNVHVPQPQPIYIGGYSNVTGEWDDYPQYLHPDFLELGSPGIYNENQSLMFPTGYGYNVQMPFGPYSPMTPPPPSARGDNQMYPTKHFPYTGPYFQQSIPPNMPYLNSPSPLSQADLAMPFAMEKQGAFISDTSTSGMHFGQRPNYPSYGPFGRSTFSGNSGNPGFYDSRPVFDGFGSSGFWSDWSKSPGGQRPLAPLSPAPVIGTFGHSGSLFSSGQASQQQRPLYGFGSSIGSYDRTCSHGGVYHQSNNYGAGLGNGRSWARLDKARRPGKDNASLCSCNGTLDFLGEQSRGPRLTRPKNSIAEENLSTDNSNSVVDWKSYKKFNFIIEYKDAKFFIIKSYSEDNIHKSIKYGVWTSTPNGNKKLDAAYREAKEKEDACPVFLFFSVNASAQFCGVAEMVGAVDFGKSVDYWQQDKWCGQFPVKWHIVKDVPNSLLRHIILENNDNKPVTNSRDTQEVKLEQGLEMLSIFKKHESEMSILDDFDFYEERQKAMQERKAWQLQHQSNSPAYPLNSGIEQRRPAPLSVNFVNQMPKSFAQVVRLDESTKEDLPAVEMDCPGPGELPNSAATLAVEGR